ncbi:hypothetical protein ACFYVK_39720 [Streptomyces chartreusis]|uniref:hypothetical protein n=1 Tax=Streptomyces chartreusis TaxID=1969 RepID=UPI00367625DF
MNTHTDPPPTGPPPQPRLPLPLLSERAPDAPHVVRQWLATAHEIPARAQAEWADQGVALLPLGRRFAAIRIPGTLIDAAVGSDTPDRVAGVLRTVLDGPVIHDRLSTGPVHYAHGRGIPWWNANDTPSSPAAPTSASPTSTRHLLGQPTRPRSRRGFPAPGPRRDP